MGYLDSIGLSKLWDKIKSYVTANCVTKTELENVIEGETKIKIKAYDGSKYYLGIDGGGLYYENIEEGSGNMPFATDNPYTDEEKTAVATLITELALGKTLSSNDFTTAEKQAIANLSNYATTTYVDNAISDAISQAITTALGGSY